MCRILLVHNTGAAQFDLVLVVRGFSNPVKPPRKVKPLEADKDRTPTFLVTNIRSKRCKRTHNHNAQERNDQNASKAHTLFWFHLSNALGLLTLLVPRRRILHQYPLGNIVGSIFALKSTRFVEETWQCVRFVMLFALSVALRCGLRLALCHKWLAFLLFACGWFQYFCMCLSAWANAWRKPHPARPQPYPANP